MITADVQPVELQPANEAGELTRPSRITHCGMNLGAVGQVAADEAGPNPPARPDDEHAHRETIGSSVGAVGIGSSADVAVIGLGLIGAAAVRHLAAAGADVVGVGPPEPTDWTTHEGVFSSHYDSGRVTRFFDSRYEWAELARRSIAAYGTLEAETGIPFHRPTGVLYATPHVDRARAIAGVAAQIGRAAPTVSAAGELDTTPYRLPADLTIIVEDGGAGHLDPRAMVQAQLAAATASGARLVRVEVVSWDQQDGGVECRLVDGGVIRAGRVLIAAGAYTTRLLPSLALSIKSETTILGRVDPNVLPELEGWPALLYDIDHPLVDEVYIVPPVPFPDGAWYVKMGCNTAFDRYLTVEDEMTEWMRGTDIEAQHEVMDEVLRSIVPDLPLLDTAVKPCLVTYTEHGLPYVDRVGERVFVAAGGNGSGAKSSDALGSIAARLVLAGHWDDPLPASSFHAVVAR